MNFRDELTFEHYDKERLLMPSIASRLTEEENAFRHKVIEYIVANHQPYTPEGDEVALAKRIHDKKNVLVVEEDGKIYDIYPVTSEEMPHKVTLADGRVAYAMCAIDALGCTYTFDQDIVVDSECSNSGAPIHIEVKDKKIVSHSPDEIRVLNADLQNSEVWAEDCCCGMLYFKSQKDFDEYAEKNHLCPDCTFCLSLEEAFSVARMLFSDNE
ncbi:organomercurial lyase [Mobilibacterium timonense]|uniref:organomercurial lyase n=1 Tax=Mobilibacterium timonense TaxID=1871012 RepID=UPI003A92CBB9